MKIFFLQLLFVFSQFFSLVFPLNSLDKRDIEFLNIYVKQSQDFSQNQKWELNRALILSAGIDNKLSEVEWKTFLLAEPKFKYNSSYSKFLKIIEAEFSRNSRIKTENQSRFINNLFLSFSHELSNKLFNKLINKPTKIENYHLVVYGNELTTVAVATMAARGLRAYKNSNKIKPKILLVRKNKKNDAFGGLLNQGALSYLDRNQKDANLTPSSEFYREFLKRAQVKRISADPLLVNEALKNLILENNIEVHDETLLEPVVINNEIKFLKLKNINGKSLEKIIKADTYVDTTPEAELARSAGLKYSLGFQTLGFPEATLPVSPVFITKGLNKTQLQQIERKILANPVLMKQIKGKLYSELDKDFADWLLKNINSSMHIGTDFIDFRSIALGAAYHLYRDKPYDFNKGFLFDRANIAILKDGDLSWNAILYKFNSQQVMELVDSGYRPSEEMLQELKELEKWLNSFKVAPKITVVPPQELYIRQSLNILDVKEPMTGQEMLHGGRPPEKAVGTFCYHFDVRGGIEGLSGKMPKPTFNFGIEHSLSKISNLAVVGRSAGYIGLAPAAGRILELNTSIASFIGVAAAIASSEKRPIYSVTSKEAKEKLERITGVPVILDSKDSSKEFNDPRII